ncbi:toll/interleukin-1 receptor domain-containing protein [Amycolatopsis sp. NPDC049252]|uniref:toll/interleukin-1 receptor domain-containing protein n=1 Tax=Amycolatopsis sp. NPDC049252 TaxID=3363933 RepID=UPI00371EE341
MRELPPGATDDKVISAVRVLEELVVLQDPAEAQVRPDGTHGVSRLSRHAWPESELELFPGFRADLLEPMPRSAVALDDPAGRALLDGVLGPYRIEYPAGPVGAPMLFLNYRTAAGTEEVLRLDRELRRRLGRHAVFRDHRELQAGDEYPVKLLDGVRQAKVLLAVIGPRWEDTFDAHGGRLVDDSSDWVRREIAEAFRRGVRVVPIILGLRGPLSKKDLPRNIERLATLQVVQLAHRGSEASLRAFVDDLLAQIWPLLQEGDDGPTGP